MSRNKLNPRQKNFVDNLLKGMTQTKAYEEAGYKATGSSARVNASKLIKKQKVQEELESRRKNRIRAVKTQIAKLLSGALKTHSDILTLDNVSDLDKDEFKKLKLKLKSAKDVLDRCNIGSKETKIEVNQKQEQGIAQKEENILKIVKEAKEKINEYE